MQTVVEKPEHQTKPVMKCKPVVESEAAKSDRMSFASVVHDFLRADGGDFVSVKINKVIKVGKSISLHDDKYTIIDGGESESEC